MKKGILGRIKEIEAIRSKLVLKNLCICLGISLSMLGGSIGIPSIGEVYSEEVEAATQFKDDKNIRDYAREAVESLVSNGGIKGYPDGTLKPSGTITRIEYLSMAMNAIDPSGSARAEKINYLKNNSDGPGHDNYYNELKDDMSFDIQDVWGGKAQDLLVITPFIGTGCYDGSASKVNGRSGWLQPITRAEAAQMLVGCLTKLGGEELPVKENVESIIGDWDLDMTVSHKDRNYDIVAANSRDTYIKQLYSAGIVTGDEQRAFRPSQNLTREQAAQTIYKAVNKDKRSAVIIPEIEKPVIENTTLKANDPNRRTAIAGDKFIASDGKTYDVDEQTGGILMSDTAIALDAGRYMSKCKEYVENYSQNDGTLDGIRRGAYYCINPET